MALNRITAFASKLASTKAPSTPWERAAREEVGRAKKSAWACTAAMHWCVKVSRTISAAPVSRLSAPHGKRPDMFTVLKQETFLLLALIAAFVAYPLEHWLLNSGQAVALIGGLVLIAFIVVASMRVAHHAELLAEKVGDPYGTMILTLAAVLVEVVILAIMMSNEASPTLVRDTIYSAVIL